MSPSIPFSGLPARLKQQIAPRPEVRQAKAEEARRKRDALRARFRLLCTDNNLPIPTTEYWFAWEAMRRRWPFDFAWIDEKIALEVDGGLFSQGAHVRGAYILKTHDKLNAATGLGWRMLYRTPDNLCSAHTVDILRAALERR